MWAVTVQRTAACKTQQAGCWVAGLGVATHIAGNSSFHVAGQPLRCEYGMIRAALALAAARAAAPLDAATTKRLDQLQELLHQAHTRRRCRPGPSRTKTPTPLIGRRARTARPRPWRRAYCEGRVVRKRIKCTDPITNAGAHT